MRLLRFAVGRWLIHAGLAAMPPGRVRDELDAILRKWGTDVRAELEPFRMPPVASYQCTARITEIREGAPFVGYEPCTLTRRSTDCWEYGCEHRDGCEYRKASPLDRERADQGKLPGQTKGDW